MTNTGLSAAAAFIAYLEGLSEREERGALAALRRAAGRKPGTDPAVYPILVPRVPGWARGWTEQTFYLVGSLYALHPEPWTGEGRERYERNFGSSLRKLKDKLGDRAESLDTRMIGLLSADTDQLPDVLRRVVSLLKADDIPIDWEVLLGDLRNWGHEDGVVQKRWATAYWGER